MAEMERRSQLKKERQKSIILQLRRVGSRTHASIVTRTAVLTQEMVEDSKKLLSNLGIPYIQAPSEGESPSLIPYKA